MSRTTASVFCLALLVAARAEAWNVVGHEAVAAIAYDVLAKEHPKTLAKVVEMLKAHPLPTKMAKQMEAMDVPAGSEGKASLMVAARFPDDVRYGPKGFSHPTWHYVDFPLSTSGDSTTGPQPETPNALTALAGQIAVVKGNNPAADKAVALCWIEHLVGDLHQPLHAVSLYTKEQPTGDRGGNETFVKFAGSKSTTNLHSAWDGLLGKDSKFTPTARIATELLSRPEYATRAKLPEIADGDPEHWAKESFDLAKRVAYLNATLHGGEEKNGVPLPASYGKDAKAAGERRVVLAGYRLADVLVGAVGE